VIAPMHKITALVLPLATVLMLGTAAHAQYRDDDSRYQQRSGGGFFDNLFGGSERLRGDSRQQPQRREQRQERAEPRYEQPRAEDARGDEGDLAVRIDQLEGRIRQLTGTVEELEHRNRQLEEQLRAQGGTPERRGEAPAAPRSVQTAGQLPPPDVPGSPAPPLRERGAAPSTGSIAGAPGRRNDAFDPDANPNAPGVPQRLGSPNSRTPAPQSQSDVGPRGGRERGEPLDIGASGEGVDPTPAPGAAPGPVREARAIPGPLPAPPQRNSNGTGAQPQPVFAPSAGPRDQLTLAQGFIQRREYPQAEESLRDFLKKNPNDRQVGEAHYWLGESLYQRQAYRDAAESFLTVSTKHGKTGKAADALMRLGQSLAALGEKDAACATLAEVTRKYPNANAGVKQTVEREQKRVRCQ
jgi:tol-pal system protein YbgF